MPETEEVAVENAPPRLGYYHRPEEVDEQFALETMSRSEAEQQGYDPCENCFADGEHDG